jgi:hypothetical protein
MGRIILVFVRRLWYPLLVLAGFRGVYVIFYMRVEGLRPLDALFWAIHPHSIEYRAVHKSTSIPFSLAIK